MLGRSPGVLQQGFQLMDLLASHLQGITADPEVFVDEHRTLLGPGGISIRLAERGEEPPKILVYRESRCIFEFDLSRLILDKGRYTWYLSSTPERRNREFLRKVLPWKEDVGGAYRSSVLAQRGEGNWSAKMPKGGFLFLENANHSTLEQKFVAFVESLMEMQIAASSSRKSDK